MKLVFLEFKLPLDMLKICIYSVKQFDSLNYPIARASVTTATQSSMDSIQSVIELLLSKRVGYCESIDRTATVTTGDTTADRRLLQLPFQRSSWFDA